MRNIAVCSAVSLILTGCGGGSAPPAPSTNTPSATPASTPTVVKDPLRIVTGASYDANDSSLNPRWVIADFNKDGTKDIFLRYDPESAFTTSNVGTSPVRFFLGKSDGGFEQSTSIFPEGYSTTLANKIVAGDFNGDGGTDILIATAGIDPYVNSIPQQSGLTGNYAQILTYTPNGYKLSKISNSPLSWAHHASTGDINGDYLADVLVDSLIFAEPFFVMGDSNGNYKADTTRFPKNTFTFRKNILETFSDGSPKKWEDTFYTSSTLADINGDGSADVVMFASASTKNSVVYLNDGSGHFSDDRTIKLPAGPYGQGYEYYASATTKDNRIRVGTIYLDSIAVDINGDGKKDLISITTNCNQDPANYVYYRGAALQILINNGNGFVDESKSRTDFSYNPGNNYTHYDTIEYADINNDKIPDILLHRGQVNPNDNASPTRILINDGKGHFTEKAYPKSLPNGILTVIGNGHYAVLISTKDNSTGKTTQRVDDVYYDWSLGQSLFP